MISLKERGTAQVFQSFESSSEKETEDIGGGLARSFREGDVVLLHGGLGAGKTCLIRGVVAALHHNEGGMVKSPSYTIMNVYEGCPTVYHFDFFRIEDPADREELGLDDYWGRGICMVEWPRNFSGPFPGRKIDVIISIEGESERKIEVKKGQDV